MRNLLQSYKQLSSILSLCGRERRRRVGRTVHAAIIKNNDLFAFNFSLNSNQRDLLVVWNSLISFYSKCGYLCDAIKVFDEMSVRDAISWNSIISALFSANEIEKGIDYFITMRTSGACSLDHATLTTVLSVCEENGFVRLCTMVHALIVSMGFEQDVPVGNALITAYFNCECLDSARSVFDGMVDKTVVTWTAMVSGLAKSQMFEESLVVFQKLLKGEVEANSLTYSSSLQACSGLRAVREGMQIHGLVVKCGFESDLCLETALMDMYSKCGMMNYAYKVFFWCNDPDEIFFTVLLVGFAQNGAEDQALNFFSNVVEMGVEIDADMISAVLGAFGTYAPHSLGKQIHGMIVKKGLGWNAFVSNGLINMYSKCGEIGDSAKIFRLMVHKNSVSWNSMIAAFARHGHGAEALKLYDEMKSQGIEATDVTFISLLHACSHVGSVEKGVELLGLMSRDHGIAPRLEHYACVVDMLGRARRLREAKKFIGGLSVEPKTLLWQALLGASSIQGDLEIGKYAAEQLLLVTPDCHAAYVLSANIYSSEGRWDERGDVIRTMKAMGVKKDTGVSWIEIKKELHCFSVEDKDHLQAESVYEILNNLAACISDLGHTNEDWITGLET